MAKIASILFPELVSEPSNTSKFAATTGAARQTNYSPRDN
jgi:hypothetical protein